MGWASYLRCPLEVFAKAKQRDFEVLPHHIQAPEGIASAVPAQDHATFERSSWPAGLTSIFCKPFALHQIPLPAQPQPTPQRPPDPTIKPQSPPAPKATPSQNSQKRYPGDTPKAQKGPRQAQGPFSEVGRYPQKPKSAAASPRVQSNVGLLSWACRCGRRVTKGHGWLQILRNNTAARRLYGTARIHVSYIVPHSLG